MRHGVTRKHQHRMDRHPANGAAPRTASRAFEVGFAAAPLQVGRTRRIADAFLGLWDVPGPLAEDIVLAVSELVTNGVEHGGDGEDIRLRARCAGGRLRVEVTDGNHAPATPRTAGEDDESGRGLLLVTVLAHRWGTSADGRTTWCEFRVPAGRA